MVLSSSHAMGYVISKISRNRVLVLSTVCAIGLCLALVSFMDKWAPQAVPQLLPAAAHVNELGGEGAGNKAFEDLDQMWEDEYQRRVQRVRDVCERDEIAAMRRVWRVAANRRFGKEAHCKTRLCPIIVDEQRVLFFCFIPKVASSVVKRFFLNVSGVAVNESLWANDSAFHLVANERLRRVSPMYYPSTTVNRFFKIVFVRHPFDRLVSAFRSKAEAPRESVRYFYDRFWDPVMKKLRPEGAPLDRITFAEFVWYLTHSLEKDFDEHWAPYWSRCDPCLVDYDFIGKVETARHDFPYAFEKVGINFTKDWWGNAKPTSRSLTMKYFSTVSEEAIQRLYKVYKLDFELFGYSLHGFLYGNSTDT